MLSIVRLLISVPEALESPQRFGGTLTLARTKESLKDHEAVPFDPFEAPMASEVGSGNMLFETSLHANTTSTGSECCLNGEQGHFGNYV
jgi:hypothetical protein